jgi:TrkA domain protein
MATRETELPGVGKKYSIELATGDELVLVEHRAGHWDLARVEEDGSAEQSTQLQPREAAEVGRILSRSSVALEDARKQMLFDEFAIEWVTLEEDSALVGETLQGSGIRARTGVNVIALLRAEGSVPSPPPDTRFQVGDTLVVIGLRDQVERFLSTYALLPPES